jgi:hypothetical protein
MTSENKVKQKVARLLKEAGAYYFFPAASSGMPDIVGCLSGNFFAIQCEAGTKQELELERIRKGGGRAIVINENRIDVLKNDLLDPEKLTYLGEQL